MSHYILNHYSKSNNILNVFTHSIAGTNLPKLFYVTLEQKYHNFDLYATVIINCEQINNI